MRRKVEVWFDGGGVFGFGNIRRSAELAQALSQRGHEVHCVPLSEPAAVLCPIPCTVPGHGPEYIVLDAPYPGDTLVAKALATGARVIALDYEGTKIAPDLVISLQDARPLPPGSQVFCGVEYAIIREEIRNVVRSSQRNEEILVIVGGGDLSGLAERIVSKLEGQSVCVVQGPAGKPFSISQSGIRLVNDPANLPELMTNCSWGVTTGGTTMLEMLCIGRAIHVVPRTAAERTFAERFSAQGALLGLGLDELKIPPPGLIRQCEKRGPELVDGEGCQRIAKMIETGL